jgi:hypothetical protein
MRMLLSFAVLALTASPAIAELPFKGEYKVRLSSDGRAEQREDISSRRDAYDRAPSRAGSTGSERIARDITPPVPLKADIALRMQHGDNRDGADKQHSGVSRQAQNNQPETYKERQKPPIPLKMDIAIKLQHGDNREGADKNTSSGLAQKTNTTSKGVFYHVLSMDQKEALCRQTGVCLPQKFNTGDSDEK